MKKNKIMTISVVLVMALAFSGIAYAHWYDQVHIEGIVHGGTVNIAFDYFEPPQCAEFHEINGVLFPGEYLGKDVGNVSCKYSVEDYDVHTNKSGWQRLDINITCAYPSYRAHTTFKIHNIGTVPVNICKFYIYGGRYTKQDVWEYDLIFVPYDPSAPYEGELWEDRDNSGDLSAGDVLVINLDIINGYLPYQLDPCHTNKMELDIHFKQNASQCHRYYIWVWIYGLQWNKDCELFFP